MGALWKEKNPTRSRYCKALWDQKNKVCVCMLSIRGDVRGLEPEIPPQRKKEGQEEKKNYRIWSFLSVFFSYGFLLCLVCRIRKEQNE